LTEKRAGFTHLIVPYSGSVCCSNLVHIAPRVDVLPFSIFKVQSHFRLFRYLLFSCPEQTFCFSLIPHW
jgi:hypothetical protein